MFDWQLIIVAFALILACSYIGWRAWLRLSSLSISKRMNAPSCGDGCGSCRKDGTELSELAVEMNPRRALHKVTDRFEADPLRASEISH